MKSSRLIVKVTPEHPMHRLYEAASELVERTVQAYKSAEVPVPDSFSLPVWVDGNPVMKITIEVGSKTTAEYELFKEHNK